MSLSSYEVTDGDTFFQEMLYFLSDVLFSKTLPNPDPVNFPENPVGGNVSPFQILMRSKTVNIAGNNSPIDEMNLSGMSVFTQAGACAPFCSPSVDPDKWYSRGAGHCQCEGNYSDWGLTCRHNDPYWGFENCHDCHKDEEKYAGGILCYPKCKPGYSVSTVTTCSQNDKICGAAALGARLGRIYGLSYIELVEGIDGKPKATIVVQDNNFIISLDAKLPKVTYKGSDGDIFGTARPFTVPCDENWENHLPRDVSFGVGTQELTNIAASINITVPFTVNNEFLNKTLTLHFEQSNMTFTGINADFLQIAVGSVIPSIFPDIFSYVNGRIGSVIQGLIPTNLLSYLPDEYKNYVLHLLFNQVEPIDTTDAIIMKKANRLIDILNSKRPYWWSNKNYLINTNDGTLTDTKDTRDIQKNIKQNKPLGVPLSNFHLSRENRPMDYIVPFVPKVPVVETPVVESYNRKSSPSYEFSTNSSDAYTSLSKSYKR